MLSNNDADAAGGMPKFPSECHTNRIPQAEKDALVKYSSPITPTRNASSNAKSAPPDAPLQDCHNNTSVGNLVELVHVPSDVVLRPIRSCMSVSSLDESLRSPTYPSRTRRKKFRRTPSCQSDSQSVDNSVSFTPTDRLSVSFHTLEIREYERALGDNPSCSRGPSMTIGWRYSEPCLQSVDDYEEKRLPRRETFQMVLPQPVREEMLLNSGHTRSQIMTAVKGNNITKGQRQKTLNTLGMQKFEEITESAGRKFRRVFRGKADKKRTEEWKLEADRARKAIQAEYEAAELSETDFPSGMAADLFLTDSRLRTLCMSGVPEIIGTEEDAQDPPAIIATEEDDAGDSKNMLMCSASVDSGSGYAVGYALRSSPVSS
eukprot:CAMPEP_0194291066 /NCGR_PEP_ID=MMETSP0169-20130528/42651_1 /TAXON_ID=218684 /ORGANISM="Corethron pennatum, Strain L29A3" /LENGTH=374 /DNA_ID=CAMNT_0039038837 /DNA_START=16 /DNA_END=1140 /DNA_ORIENTATION=-